MGCLERMEEWLESGSRIGQPEEAAQIGTHVGRLHPCLQVNNPIIIHIFLHQLYILSLPDRPSILLEK